MTDIPTGPQPSLGKGGGLVLALVPHPDFPSRAIQSISVDVDGEAAGCLFLKYRVTGAIEEVLWPNSQPRSSGPTDRLWEHSCFEAFVGRPDEPGYIELNVTTALEWALYAFDDYRAGMTAIDTGLSATVRFGRDSLEAHVSLLLPDWLYDADLQLALSAIIEAKDGSKSYWALKHPPGPPDFHNRDCFTARLAAPSAA
jgi:hypothetical protein